MAIRLRLLTLAVLTLFLAPAFAEEKAEEFKSEAGRFSIVFPSKPEELKRSAITPAGMLDIYLFTAREEKKLYILGYLDYPEATVKELGPDAVLESNRDSFVETVKGKLLTDKKLTLDGNPGREFTVEAPNTKFQLREFLVRNRLYQVVAGAPDIEAPEVKRFQDSFKLLK